MYIVYTQARAHTHTYIYIYAHIYIVFEIQCLSGKIASLSSFINHCALLLLVGQAQTGC